MLRTSVAVVPKLMSDTSSGYGMKNRAPSFSRPAHAGHTVVLERSNATAPIGASAATVTPPA